MEIANGLGVVFLKFAIQIRIVILSEAKDLLSYQRTKQQVLRFAQDDNIIMRYQYNMRYQWSLSLRVAFRSIPTCSAFL